MKLQGTPKVLLRRRVVEIERFLCFKEQKREWCGILFYKMKGDLENPDELEFDVLYLYPMHIGTSGGTTIENYEEVLDLYDEHPELEEDDVRQGFIHSHNSMDTFFSGTDNKQLEDGADDYDLFLSVITNNAQDYVAKISFKLKEETTTKTLFGLSFSKEEEKTAFMKCAITYEVCGDENDFIKGRYEEILEAKKAEDARTQTTYPYTSGTVGTAGHQTSIFNKNDVANAKEDSLMNLMMTTYPETDHPDLYRKSTRQFHAASYWLKTLKKVYGIETNTSRYVGHFNALKSSIINSFNAIQFRMSDEAAEVTAEELGKELLELIEESTYSEDELISAIVMMDFHIRHNIAFTKGEQWLKDEILNIMEGNFVELLTRYQVLTGDYSDNGKTDKELAEEANTND